MQATTGGAGGGTFDNPFDAESGGGGAFVPPAPVQPPPAVVQSAYHDSAPAPTNTYGAYDTGAYDGGGGGSNAYAVSARTGFVHLPIDSRFSHTGSDC